MILGSLCLVGSCTGKGKGRDYLLKPAGMFFAFAGGFSYKTYIHHKVLVVHIICESIKIHSEMHSAMFRNYLQMSCQDFCKVVMSQLLSLRPQPCPKLKHNYKNTSRADAEKQWVVPAQAWGND